VRPPWAAPKPPAVLRRRSRPASPGQARPSTHPGRHPRPGERSALVGAARTRRGGRLPATRSRSATPSRSTARWLVPSRSSKRPTRTTATPASTSCWPSDIRAGDWAGRDSRPGSIPARDSRPPPPGRSTRPGERDRHPGLREGRLPARPRHALLRTRPPRHLARRPADGSAGRRAAVGGEEPGDRSGVRPTGSRVSR
jgi:hypothetical protein